MPEKILDKNTGLMASDNSVMVDGIKMLKITPPKFNSPLPVSTGINQGVDLNMVDKLPELNRNVGSIDALNQQVASTQSTGKAVINGLAKHTLGFGFNMLQIPAMLPLAPIWLAKAGFDWASGDTNKAYESFSHIYNNSMTQGIKQAEEWVNQNIPIYADYRYDSDNLLERMGTAKFWADDGFDGLSFLLSAYAGGAGAMKGTTWAVTKLGAKIGGKLGAGLIANTKLLGYLNGITLNTVTEAGVESQGIYNEIYNSLIERGVPDKEAKKRAAESGANVFGKNLAILLPSNAFQMKMFFGNPIERTRKELFDLARKSGGVTQKVSYIKEGLKQAGAGVISEGLWEEGIQNAITSWEKQKVENLYKPGILGEQDIFDGIITEYMKGFTTKEGQNSMAIGAILGGIGGGVGSIRETKSKQLRNQQASKLYNDTQELEKASDKLFIDYSLKRHITDDKGKIVFDDDNVGVDNPEFYKNRAKQIMTDAEMVAERNFNVLNNDEVALAFTDSFYLSRKLFTYLANPIYNNTNDAFDVMSKRLEDDIKSYGEENGENADEALATYLKSTKPLLQNIKKEYDKIQKTLYKINTGSVETDSALSEKLKRMMFYNVAKIAALEKIKENTADDVLKNDIDGMIDATKELNERIGNTKSPESKTFYKNLLEDLDNTIKFKKKKEDLNNIIKDPKTTNDDLKKAQNELEKLRIESGSNFFINGVSEINRLGTDGVDISFNDNEKTKNQLSTDYWKIIGKKRSMHYFEGKNYEQISKIKKSLNDIVDQLEDTQEFTDNNIERIFKETINTIKHASNPELNLSPEDKLEILSIVNTFKDSLDESYDEQKYKLEQILSDIALPELRNQNPDFDNLTIDEQGDYIAEAIEGFLKFAETDIIDLEILPEDEAEDIKLKIEAVNNLQKYKTDLQMYIKLLDSVETNQNKYLVEYKGLAEEDKNDFLFKDYLNDPSSEYAFDAQYNNIKDIEQLIKDNNEVELDKLIALPVYMVTLRKYKLLKEYLEEKNSDTKLMKNLLKQVNEIIDFYENTLIPLATKNNEKRGAFQQAIEAEETNNVWSMVGVDIQYDISTGQSYIDYNPYADVIKKIIGASTYDTILTQAKDAIQSEGNVMDIVYAERILNILRAKTAEELKSLTELIDANAERAYLAFTAFTYANPKKAGLLSPLVSSFSTEGYKKDPKSFIYSILKDNFNNVVNIDYFKSPLYSYFQHSLISKLVSEVQASNNVNALVPTSSFLELIANHNAYATSIELRKAISQKPLFLDFNKKLKELNQKEAVALNTEQQIAVKSIFTWLKDPKATVSGYLQGVAGSGKTTVVLNYVLKMAGVDSSKILATAHNESASKTVNKAIGIDESNAITLDRLFSTPDALTGKQILIIDEINANDNDNYLKILSLIKKENEKRKAASQSLLRVLTMGDPNQIKRESTFSILEQFSIDKTIETTVFPKLTLPYRSDIGAINSLASAFQNTPLTIKNLVLKTSAELNDPEALGTKSVATTRNADNTLTDFIVRIAAAKSNGRSKAIIVSDEKMIQAYRNQLNTTGDSTTEILTIYDAQGKTFDEVYVDILKDDIIKGESYQDRVKYNTVMYTALSRATKYVAVLDETNSFGNSIDTKTIDESKDALEREKKELKETIETITTFRIKMLGEAIAPGTTTPKTPPVKPGEPNDSSDTTDQDDTTSGVPTEDDTDPLLTDPKDPKDSTESTTEIPDPSGKPIDDVNPENNSNTHIILAPSAEMINKVPSRAKTGNRPYKYVVNKHGKQVKELYPYVEVGSDVLYVKGSRKVKNVIQKVIFVLGRVSDTTQNGDDVTHEINKGNFYEVISVIYPENINEQDTTFTRNLLEKFNNTTDEMIIDKKSIEASRIINNGIDHPSILYKGKISFTQDLSFTYGNVPLSTDRGLFNYILDKVNPLIVKKHLLSNEEVGSDGTYGTISSINIRIFTTGEIKLNSSLQKNLKETDAGFPYAIVNVNVKGNITPFFIRLEPRRLRNDDAFIQPLLTFKDSIVKAELAGSLIGLQNFKWNTQTFNKIINLYRFNFIGEEDGVDWKNETKYKVSPLPTSKVTLEELKKVLLENPLYATKIGSEITDEMLDSLHNKLTEEAKNIIPSVFSARKQTRKVSLNQYLTFLEAEVALGKVKQEDIDELKKTITELNKTGLPSSESIKRIKQLIPSSEFYDSVDITFTERELEVLMNKSNLATYQVHKAYANNNIKMEDLPVPPRDMPGFRGRTFMLYTNQQGHQKKLTYLQYRIRGLRRIIGNISYVPIQGTTQYYALDPLDGSIIIVDKILEKGFVSKSQAEKEGVTRKEFEEIGLTKQQSPAAQAMYVLSRANAKVNDKDLRISLNKSNKRGQSVIIAPPLLSYKEEYGVDIDSKFLGLIRKSFNVWYENEYYNTKVEDKEIFNELKVNDENGNLVTFQIENREGMKITKDVGKLRKSVQFEDEHNFNALVDFLIERSIPLADGTGRPMTKEILEEFFEETNAKKDEKLTSEDLNDLLNFDSKGNSKTLRRPLSKGFIEKLSNDKDDPTLTEDERKQAKEELENLLTTNLESVKPTQIHVTLNKEKESNTENQNEPEPEEKSSKKPGVPPGFIIPIDLNDITDATDNNEIKCN